MKAKIFYSMTIGPRSQQEDCLLVGDKIFQDIDIEGEIESEEGNILLTVCDGMGGYEAGEKNSKFVCEQLKEKLNVFSTKNIKNLLYSIQALSIDLLPPQSGTTVAGIAISNNNIIIFNAGDSRVYKLNQKGIQYISHDHSFVQQLIDQKMINEEQAFSHPHKNIINFGVGPAFVNHWGRYEINCIEEEVITDNAYLICSDGLNTVLKNNEIYNILMPDPFENGRLLMKNLKQKELRDNTSFILIKFLP
ncbi:MAG: serine/threonine-protein phosphatase [Desulfobacterales bacterium]|nr:serine/threonine-protein phosphatase [Desulfobacterales bacterium]